MNRCLVCGAGPLGNCGYYGAEVPRESCPLKERKVEFPSQRLGKTAQLRRDAVAAVMEGKEVLIMGKDRADDVRLIPHKLALPKPEAMNRIPIKAAREIAEAYGYDQVMIYARKVGDAGGEHMTTYGVTKAHCSAMAKIAAFLQTKIMGWSESTRPRKDGLISGGAPMPGTQDVGRKGGGL